jgi:hypothetical protein
MRHSLPGKHVTLNRKILSVEAEVVVDAESHEIERLVGGVPRCDGVAFAGRAALSRRSAVSPALSNLQQGKDNREAVAAD